MTTWSDQLQLAPKSDSLISEDELDAFERIDTELRRQMLKKQQKLGEGEVELMADAASHNEAIAYLSTGLCRQLMLDIMGRGYVVSCLMTFDDDGPLDGPHVSMKVAVPT
jgi:hypothetical protein